jgi:Domain of unknown function (DUF4258)
MIVSQHAHQRLAQRNLTVDDVSLVCDYGIREHRAGVICYFLGRRQAQAIQHVKDVERLIGVTVLCCPHCRCVITAYHNQHGMKRHRHKSKRQIITKQCSACTPLPQCLVSASRCGGDRAP